jgi:large subunit ribosomal protein L29
MTKRATELRALDDTELEHQLVEAKAELFNLRFKHVTGELPNMARLGDLRRDIARIHTLLREREIEAFEAAQTQETVSELSNG